MFRKTLLVLLGLILALSFAGIASADCYDLANGAKFGVADFGKTIVLCQKAYIQTVEIKDVDELTLDCAGSTLNGGIVASGTTRLSVKDCIVGGPGVLISNSYYLALENLRLAKVGITLRDIVVGLVRNSAISNAQMGVQAFNITSVEFSANTFSKNSIGVSLDASNKNTVTSKNIFEGNTIGLQLSASTDNKIFKNVFKKSDAVGSSCAKVLGNVITPNAWDNGAEGNYWSDYAGADANGDGIGDTPYLIENANVDNKPFMKEDLTKGAVTEINIIGEVKDRSGSYNFSIGDAVRFSCGSEKDNKTFTVALTGTDPVVLVKVGKEELELKSYASNTFDLNNDGASDVNFAVKSHSRNQVVMEVIRLDPCFFYCGDGKCTAGETVVQCKVDCEASLGEVDSDADEWTIAMGDCDDSNPKIYPDASEKCSAEIDYDCDGLKGDADPDCKGLGFWFWFLVVFVILAAGAAVFFWFWEKKPEAIDDFIDSISPTTEETSEPEAGDYEDIQRIMDYAENYLAKGHTKEETKDVLMTQGWSEADIDKALRKLKA